MPQPSMTCQKIPIAGRLDLWYNANDIEVSSRQSVGIAGKEDALAGVFFMPETEGWHLESPSANPLSALYLQKK